MIEKSLNLDASDDLAEDNVVSVKPGCRGSGDEKLGTISVRALVCHRQQTRSEKAFVIISQVFSSYLPLVMLTGSLTATFVKKSDFWDFRPVETDPTTDFMTDAMTDLMTNPMTDLETTPISDSTFVYFISQWFFFHQ